MRILYDSFNTKYKTPFGTIRQGEKFRLSIEIPHTVGANKVTVFFQDGCTNLSLPQTMFEIKAGNPYDTFSGEFRLPVGLYFYFFNIEQANHSFRLFKQGHDTNMEYGDCWQLSVIADQFSPPEWARGAIFYQIYPDRFFKAGECCTKGKIQPWTMHTNWNDEPDWRPDHNGEITNSDFFGGNLNGIREKLPYLKDLGVSAIYLNPIFKAWSNHRYDTADYKEIDPLLGNLQDFRSLCSKAHELGIRIILDGVFSHTGDKSKYFKEAVSSPDSPYRDWYLFWTWPNSYKCWWDFKTLPVLNKENPGCRNYLVGGEDSVVSYWLKNGADGWRLDVADELSDQFIYELKTKIRSTKADSLLIGEVWEDASNKIAYDKRRRYLIDNELDSVMNYPFQKAIISYCSGSDDGTILANTLETLTENYPQAMLDCCLNLLSTHDTARAMTAIAGGGTGNREEQAEFKIPADRKSWVIERFMTAVFLQFTLPGAPTIYYGDEAGLTGGKDPFCRGTYPWGSENSEILSFYKEITSIHEQYQDLKTGRIISAFSDHGLLSVKRSTLTIICNLSQQIQTVNNLKCLFGHNAVQLENNIQIKPNGFALCK